MKKRMDKEQRILTVKELNRYIKMKLESDRLLQNVWIRGEISNFTHHSSGHMYFTIKDADGRIKSIMFSSHNQRLGFMPKEGTRVLACGNVSVYERDGQYQFYVTQMQPDGIGSLYLAFEQLKMKLEKEGLFAQERKKSLPRFPQVIGVITSPTGAAVRDIVTTLMRRHPSVSIILFPVLVQGTQAASTIAKAIREMNRMGEVDLLIVGRGGGSLEELWPFNEEIVARSIADSLLPVISAVGHETDFTIADFVADLRAPTPTAAAELAVMHHLELKQQIAYQTQRLRQSLFAQLRAKKERLELLRRSPYFVNPRRQLLQPAERLDRLKEQLVFRMRNRLHQNRDLAAGLDRKLFIYSPKSQILMAKKRTQNLQHQLLHAMQGLLKTNKQEWMSKVRQLDALSPLKVMQRGYSLVYDEQHRLVKSLKQVQPGDLVEVRLSDGTLDAQVWSMKGEK